LRCELVVSQCRFVVAAERDQGWESAAGRLESSIEEVFCETASYFWC
jgi:hypothetical protein